LVLLIVMSSAAHPSGSFETFRDGLDALVTKLATPITRMVERTAGSDVLLWHNRLVPAIAKPHLMSPLAGAQTPNSRNRAAAMQMLDALFCIINNYEKGCDLKRFINAAIAFRGSLERLGPCPSPLTPAQLAVLQQPTASADQFDAIFNGLNDFVNQLDGGYTKVFESMSYDEVQAKLVRYQTVVEHLNTIMDRLLESYTKQLHVFSFADVAAECAPDRTLAVVNTALCSLANFAANDTRISRDGSGEVDMKKEATQVCCSRCKYHRPQQPAELQAMPCVFCAMARPSFLLEPAPPSETFVSDSLPMTDLGLQARSPPDLLVASFNTGHTTVTPSASRTEYEEAPVGFDFPDAMDLDAPMSPQPSTPFFMTHE
jgi:hypothetical protein